MGDSVESMLAARKELQSLDPLVSPGKISEVMYKLAQYTSSAEEYLGELEEKLEKDEALFFQKMREQGKSVNATQVEMKYKFSPRKAQIIKITRLTSSSWKLISASQSRLRSLVEESKNQL